MKGESKKIRTSIIASAVIVLCAAAGVLIWFFNFRTNYKLMLNQTLITCASYKSCPTVDIVDFDNDKWNCLNNIDLNNKMGLWEPYFYYTGIIEDKFGEDYEGEERCFHWLNCDIVSYDNDEVVVHYYGSNTWAKHNDENKVVVTLELDVDDVWKMDISGLRKGESENGVVYLNDSLYERTNHIIRF